MPDRSSSSPPLSLWIFIDEQHLVGLQVDQAATTVAGASGPAHG